MVACSDFDWMQLHIRRPAASLTATADGAAAADAAALILAVSRGGGGYATAGARHRGPRRESSSADSLRREERDGIRRCGDFFHPALGRRNGGTQQARDGNVRDPSGAATLALGDPRQQIEQGDPDGETGGCKGRSSEVPLALLNASPSAPGWRGACRRAGTRTRRQTRVSWKLALMRLAIATRSSALILEYLSLRAQPIGRSRFRYSTKHAASSRVRRARRRGGRTAQRRGGFPRWYATELVERGSSCGKPLPGSACAEFVYLGFWPPATTGRRTSRWPFRRRTRSGEVHRFGWLTVGSPCNARPRQ